MLLVCQTGLVLLWLLLVDLVLQIYLPLQVLLVCQTGLVLLWLLLLPPS